MTFALVLQQVKFLQRTVSVSNALMVKGGELMGVGEMPGCILAEAPVWRNAEDKASFSLSPLRLTTRSWAPPNEGLSPLPAMSSCR